MAVKKTKKARTISSPELSAMRRQVLELIGASYKTTEEFCWEHDLNKATLSNFLNGLLIPPSNMSEILVGYWTEGGDNSGGADWVGGVEKSRLLRYLKVRHKRGLFGLPPLKVLRFVLDLQPSAELAPSAGGKKQTDEGDLGRYEIRDRIQHLLWVELIHPVQILEILVVEFPHDRLDELYRCLDNVLRLFPITHWKRIRQALSIRVSDHDLDHRGDMRWPVLSANFKHERDELRFYYEVLSTR